MKVSGMRAFVMFGIGQVVSVFGTSLSSFALGVWAFNQTQSVMQFALVTIFIIVPGIFIKPIAGALVDRWDRRYMLILSDLLAVLPTVVAIILVYIGYLNIWYIYLMAFVQSVAASLQLPASSAAIQLLIPSAQFGKASGMLGAVKSVSTIVAPLIAGLLVSTIGLEGILFVDVLTFVCAMITLSLVYIPNIQYQQSLIFFPSLYNEIKVAWGYITNSRSFLLMMFFSMLITGVFEAARMLLTPLVLSFTSTKALGIITSIAGFGALLGNLIMMVWGGPKRRMYGVIGFLFIIGLSLIVGALRQSVLLISLSVFIVMTGIPIAWICIEAIWLTKVPPTIIGRIKGMTNMFDSALSTIVLIVVGASADYVFEPWLAKNGWLSRSVGAIIGSGVGRGIAFMLILIGCGVVLVSVITVLNPAIRLLEDELPDIDPSEYVIDGRRMVNQTLSAKVEL